MILLLLLLLVSSSFGTHTRVLGAASPRTVEGTRVETDATCYDTTTSQKLVVNFVSPRPSLSNWVGLEMMSIGSNDDRKNNNTTTTVVVHEEWTCGSLDEDCPTTTTPHRLVWEDLKLIVFPDHHTDANYSIHWKSFGYHGHVSDVYSAPFSIVTSNHHRCPPRDRLDILSTTPIFTTTTTNGIQSSLQLEFTRIHPTSGDGIGIYPAAAASDKHHDTMPPLLWIFTNGRHHGTVSINNLDTLPTGEYYSVLGELGDDGRLLLAAGATASSAFFFVVGAPTPIYRRLDDNCPSSILVKTSQSQYTVGHDISISYHYQQEPCSGDESPSPPTPHFAIYPAHVDLSFFQATRLPPPRPLLWVCDETRDEDDDGVDMCQDGSLRQGKPLPLGSYQAVGVVRQQQQDSSSYYHHYYYASPPFQVVAEEEDAASRLFFLRATTATTADSATAA